MKLFRAGSKPSQLRPSTSMVPGQPPRPLPGHMRHRPTVQQPSDPVQLVETHALAKEKEAPLTLNKLHALTHSRGSWAGFRIPLILGVGLPLALLSSRLELSVNPTALWGFYLMALEAHPFTTKLCTGVVGALLGDLLAQVLPLVKARMKGGSASKQASSEWSYDFLRAGRFMLFSAVVGTPVASLWLSFLDSVLPGTAMQTIATKVALDQLLLCPIMTSVFFMSMCALEGQAHKAVDTVKTKLIPTMKANYALWPAAHVVNFAFVPSDQRILYVNVVALIWTVFLSSMAASSMPDKAEAATQALAAAPAGSDSSSASAAPMAADAVSAAAPLSAEPVTVFNKVE